MFPLKNNFLIAAYVAPPPPHIKNNFDNNLMENGYKFAMEAGFNACYGFYEKFPSNKEMVIKALNLAEKYNIMYFLQDENFCKNKQIFQKFQVDIAEFKDYPSFGGCQIWDEPGLKDFTLLAKMKAYYKKLLPDKMFYLNLQPLYSPSYYLENGMWTNPVKSKITYHEYVENFFRELSPTYISYDFYPHLIEGLHQDYFKQLSIIAKEAKKHNIPFWVYIQSCSWNLSAAKIPTPSEMIWQVNTSIAYGASGIQYFCYFTPYSNCFENSNVAMIDFFGNPTKLYYAAKRVNCQLRACEKELINSKHIGILKYGSETAPIPKKDLIFEKNILNIKGDVLVGVFSSTNNRIFYVVSDTTDGIPHEIFIEFAGEFSYEIIENGIISTGYSKILRKILPSGDSFMITIRRMEAIQHEKFGDS